MKIRHEMWPLECLQTKCGRRTDRQTDGQMEDGQRPVTKAHLSNQPTTTRSRRDSLTEIIFELNSCINKTNVLTRFHENWAKNVTSRKNAPPTGSHVCSPIQTIVELGKLPLYTYKEKCPTHWRPYINKTNVLTNFHYDWTKIVTSRVFTRENCHYIHIEKNAPPTGGHIFSPIWTIFELVRDIN
ncbi:hypothetical protein DPMN_193955 [Dreissena polymorpha]|uniref:Uncharacterized protein n=1 Tax=Dreissena polymorpha TaxID=45954 RepID=A0A9D3Y1D5_DREPO|nr:hypothetical protein DPMN_193955 [Dreissena polymorpha]